MKKLLLQIVSLSVCLSCFLNMSAQEIMDSLTIDSILSVRYPRIYPVYLDSTQIAEQVASCNVLVVSSAEYSETPTSVSLDLNKSVGQIPIKSGTSPTGAKTYEIPIDLYPGMNGMTPTLSLSYNSQGGNGVAGVGWSLTGVPAISRGVRNIVNDSFVSGIAMNTTDVFMLDGNRLITLSEESGYNIYESERGNIKVKGYKKSGVITYFEVYYPDGKKGVFGFSSNTENHLIYPLVSLSDIKGNTINYTYTSSNNNYTLSEISYNGVSVTFEYSTDRPDSICLFRGGLNISDTNLLKSISCKLGTDILNTYTLTHTTQNNFSVVSQIYYTAGNESFNPICFYYDTRIGKSIFETNQTILSGYYPFSGRDGIRYTRGKFNYDEGDDGLAVYPNYPTYTKILGAAGDYNDIVYRYFNNYYEGDEKIFIYSGIGKSITQAGQEITTEVGFVDLLTADLDGTQQEYLIKVNNSVVNGKDQITFKAYKVGIFSTPLEVYNRSYTLSTVYNGGNGKLSIQPKFYHVGDFNGDGKQEIMAVSANEPFGDTSLPSKVYIFDIVNGKILYENHVFDYDVEFLWIGSDSIDAETAKLNTDKLFVLDYDGDGKTDVCHINDGWMFMYYFDTSGSSIKMRQKVGTTLLSNSVLQNRELLFGEFNGDGLIDMLLSPPAGSATDKYWTMINSKGDGQFQSYRFTAIDYEDNDECGYITQDVNNDGISDILKYGKYGFYVYFVKNNKFGVENGYYGFPEELSVMLPTNVNTHNLFTQVVAFRDSKAKCYFANHDYNKESLITGMANSLGVVERNIYRKIDAASTESGFYTKGSGAVFPYVNIQEPLCVLASTETFVNGSSAEMVNYTYQNAVFHRQGLGFCGFETITSVDDHDRTKTVTYSPYKYSTPAKVVTSEYETIYNYSVSRRSNGTLRIVLGSKIENDLLKDTSMPTLIDYDDYCNPTYVSTYYPDGSAANKTNSYSNTTTVGDGYYLGSLWEQISKRHKSGETHQERIFVPAGTVGYPNVKIHYIGENQTDITVFMYDSCGNTISKNVTPYSSSVSHLTSYNYDSYGRLIKETDPMGLTKEYFFDSKGRVSATKDKRGNITTYAYDSFGRDTLTVYPDGTKKTIKYAWSTDRDGELYSITTSETGQPTETVYYDALNREVRRGTIRFDGSIIYVDKVYNSKGKLEKESLPYKTGSASLWNVYTYDEHDRVIAYTEASGRTTTYAYNGTEVTTIEDGVSITRDYDSHGNLIKVEDAAGTVTYNLWTDGQPTSIVAPGDVTTTFGYDEYRRRTSVNDPSHGLTTYHYDSAGNVSKEVNARGDSTIYEYDDYNRLIKSTIREMETLYLYNDYNELSIVDSDNGTYKFFLYDEYGRLEEAIEGYEDQDDDRELFLKKNYTYSEGNLSTVRSRSFNGELATESYHYSNGHLTQIFYNNSSPIYILKSENEFGLPTMIETVAGKREYTYTQYGLPASRIARNYLGNIIKRESYQFNPLTGNLEQRNTRPTTLVEEYYYDNLNRLAGGFSGYIHYDVKGNIIEKADVGTFEYNNTDKPYAITDVSLSGTTISQNTQNIAYTSFNRTQYISEGDYFTQFTYNSDYERVKMSIWKQTVGSIENYYLDSCYEMVVDTTDNVTERLYLGGDYYTAPAVLIKDSTGESLHFIHRDYLGSITHITDDVGDVEQELSYDPWGRLRNPLLNSIYTPGNEPALMIGRGYTGHEHLTWHGLINMNARMYDPVLGRFLSPDPFVQAPDLSQNFNRYTYAMNNPFRYTDQSGEFFLELVIGALIGGIANVVAKGVAGQLHSWGDGFAAFGIGALAGGVSAVTGAWAFGLAGGSATVLGAGGFLAGAASGAISTAVSMPILSGGNSLYFGDPFMTFEQYAVGIVSGAAMGGAMNGIAAKVNGKNFWTGKDLKPAQQSLVTEPISATNNTAQQSSTQVANESDETLRASIVGDTKDKRDYSVYYGYDKDTGEIKYVGITKREPEIRFKEHLRSGTERAKLDYRTIHYKEFTPLEARFMEQNYINIYKMIKDGGTLLNQRNSISPLKWSKDLGITNFK